MTNHPGAYYDRRRNRSYIRPIHAARIKIERCSLVRKNQFRGNCVTIKANENAAIGRKEEGAPERQHIKRNAYVLKGSTIFVLDCGRSTVDLRCGGMQPSRWSKSLIRVSSAPGCNTRSAKIWFIHHVGIIDRARGREVARVSTVTND